MSGSNAPSTPVKVPSTAASYTPATLDPDLRSQINAVLIRDGHVTKIQDHLLHTLHAHPNNWPTAVQNHALSLLRSGEVANFPALLKRVLDDIRQETLLGNSSSGSKAAAATTNGSATPEVNGKKAANGDTAPGGPQSLALPQSVIDEALKVTRESLESVCEIEDSGAA